MKRIARVDGVEQGRFYDRIVQLDDGTWVGLEVKSGSASKTAAQKAFDAAVSPTTPARVALPDGRTIDITDVAMERVPRK